MPTVAELNAVFTASIDQLRSRFNEAANAVEKLELSTKESSAAMKAAAQDVARTFKLESDAAVRSAQESVKAAKQAAADRVANAKRTLEQTRFFADALVKRETEAAKQATQAIVQERQKRIAAAENEAKRVTQIATAAEREASRLAKQLTREQTQAQRLRETMVARAAAQGIRITRFKDPELPSQAAAGAAEQISIAARARAIELQSLLEKEKSAAQTVIAEAQRVEAQKIASAKRAADEQIAADKRAITSASQVGKNAVQQAQRAMLAERALSKVRTAAANTFLTQAKAMLAATNSVTVSTLRFISTASILLVGPLSGVGARLSALSVVAGVYGTSAAGAAAATALLAGALIKAVGDAANFEHALAGVSERTGLVGADLASLGEGLLALSAHLGIAAVELTEITQVAGQLGVRGEENLLRFTKVVAQLTRVTDLGAKDAATALARMLNVTGEGAENVERLANVVAVLGDELAASEAEILKFGTEIAAAGATFGLTASQAAAFGGALASLGARAESSSTAIQRVFIAMLTAARDGGKELEVFSRTANAAVDEQKRSAKEFAELVGTDAVEAFRVFFKGLSEQGVGSIKVLGALDLAQQRSLRQFLRIAGAAELFDKALMDANEAAANQTALQEKFDRISASTVRQWEILKVRAQAFGIALGQFVLPIINKVLVALNEIGFIDYSKLIPILSGEELIPFARELSEELDAIEERMKDFEGLGLGAIFAGVEGSELEKLKKRRADIIEQLGAINKKLFETGPAGDEAAKGLKGLNSNTDLLSEKQQKAADSAREFAQKLLEEAEASRKALEAFEEGGEAAAAFETELGKARESLVRFDDAQIAVIASTLGLAGVTRDQLAVAMAEMGAESERNKDRLKVLTDAMDKTKRIATDLASTLMSNEVEARVFGKTAKELADDQLKSVQKALADNQKELGRLEASGEDAGVVLEALRQQAVDLNAELEEKKVDAFNQELKDLARQAELASLSPLNKQLEETNDHLDRLRITSQESRDKYLDMVRKINAAEFNRKFTDDLADAISETTFEGFDVLFNGDPAIKEFKRTKAEIRKEQEDALREVREDRDKDLADLQDRLQKGRVTQQEFASKRVEIEEEANKKIAEANEKAQKALTEAHQKASEERFNILKKFESLFIDTFEEMFKETIKNKIQTLDLGFEGNLLRDIPNMLVKLADTGQFIFEKFFQNVINMAGGFGNKLLEAMGFGGGNFDFSFSASGGGGSAVAGGAGAAGGGLLGSRVGGPIGGLVGSVIGKFLLEKAFEEFAKSGTSVVSSTTATSSDPGVIYDAGGNPMTAVPQTTYGGLTSQQLLAGIGGAIAGALRGAHTGADRASKAEQMEIAATLLPMLMSGNFVGAVAYGGVRAGMTATDAILGRKSFENASASQRAAGVFSPFGDRTRTGVFEDIFFGANVGKLLGLSEASGFLPDIFSERLSKGQHTRRFLAGDVFRPSAAVGSVIPEDVPFRANEAMQKFPELAAEAGNAVTAFGVAFGQAVKTPLGLTDELRTQFNMLIGSFGESGVDSEEAIIRTAALMREMGIEAGHAAALIEQAFEEGKITTQQFEMAIAGLGDITNVTSEQMVETLKQDLGEEALGVFAQLENAGVTAFDAVLAAGSDAFRAIAGGMSSDLLPRATQVFLELEALGFKTAEALKRAFKISIDFEMGGGTGWIVLPDGRLFWTGGGGAPELSDREQAEARRNAPQAQIGGTVQRTGIALIHHGEEIVTKRVVDRFDALLDRLDKMGSSSSNPSFVVAPVMEPGDTARFIRRAEKTGRMLNINPTLGIRR